MLVKEIMNRNVVTVRGGATLAEVAEVMLSRGINGLPVIDPDGRVVGMIGIRDVLRVPTPSRSDMPILRWAKLEEKAADLASTVVDKVMARRVISVGEDADVIEVAGLMANRGVHPIPVLRDGRLVGIVSRADVVRVLLAMSQATHPAK